LHAVTGEREWSHRVAHSAFAEAWTNWSKIRSLPDRTRWVRRRATRQLRLHQRRCWLTGLVPWGNRARTSPIPLMQALAHLPSVQRRALVLHYMAKLAPEQLAEEERTSTKVILQRLDHGRLALVHRASADWATGDADIASGQWALSPVDDWVARQLTYLEYRLAPRPDTRSVLIAARTARRRRQATLAAVAGVTLLTGVGTAVAATLSPDDRAGTVPVPPPLRSAGPMTEEPGLPPLPGLGDPDTPAPDADGPLPGTPLPGTPLPGTPLPGTTQGHRPTPGDASRPGTHPEQQPAPDRRVGQQDPPGHRVGQQQAPYRRTEQQRPPGHRVEPQRPPEHRVEREDPQTRSLFAPEIPPAKGPRPGQPPARPTARPGQQPGQPATGPAGPPRQADRGQGPAR
jgi:DNA-directed RNA polymerase specialized sigma24 family protein